MFFNIYEEEQLMNEDVELFEESEMIEEAYQDTDLYAEALESIIEFNEEYSILKDKMMIAEHTAIITENALLLEEEKKGFGSKVKALVEWFIKQIKELYRKFREFLEKVSIKVKGAFKKKESAKEAVAKAGNEGEKKEAPLALAAPASNSVYSTNAIKDLMNNIKTSAKGIKPSKFEKAEQIDVENEKISNCIDKCKTSMHPLESSKGNIAQKAEQLVKVMKPLANEALVIEKDLEKVSASMNQFEIAGRNANAEAGALIANFKKFLNTLSKGTGFMLQATKHNIQVGEKLAPTGFTMR